MDTAETRKAGEGNVSVLERETVVHNKGYLFVKRIQDIILSLLGIAILWPFMLILAVVIVIDSPGAGPIFSQIRVGKNGKEFRFYKFRSMKPKAEKELNTLLKDNEMDGPAFKIKEDPRITRVGKFIRKTGIDELPQLWNVLRGDMSIVGPRPALPREVERYDDFAKQRLTVTPGLTCYWQIQPKRNDMRFQKWMELDVQYIRERSFWVDWKIIFKTFTAIWNMDGV